MVDKTLKILQRLFGLFLVGSIVGELCGWKPPPVVGEGKPLMDAMLNAGYIFVVIRVVFVLSGMALLADRFAALAAIVLFPISVNILLFHAILHPPSLPQASVFFVLSCSVLYANRAAYLPLFRPRPVRPPRHSSNAVGQGQDEQE